MTTNTLPNSRRRLIDTLCETELYRNYSAAFEQMTSLPLTLEAAFEGEELPQTVTTFSITGVATTRVPVKLGKSLIAVLQTGGVRLAAVTAAHFTPIATALLDSGHSAAEIRAARDAFCKLPIMEPTRYEAAVTLLKSFASHLGEGTHRLLFATTTHEPAPVRLAKEYIMQHLTEPLTLITVSSNVNVSPFHFCKVFKRGTGMTFTDYVNHVRVEKARRMLLRPGARITDVAYDVGFQSLSHFNRSFRRIVNESPTEYRARLKTARPGMLAAA
jgi:AraC-like DNA-binding protein